MNPQQPLRFRVIGSLHVISDDSLVRDNRRDVAPQHGDRYSGPLRPEHIISFTMHASCLVFCANDAVIDPQH